MKITTSTVGRWAAALILLAGTARAAGPNVYVVPTNAAAAAPYDTWAKAATNIATAIAYANANSGVDYVIVSNGTYNTTAELGITRAYTVRSFGNGVASGLANARNTIINGAGNHRICQISANGVVLDGITIQNGYAGGDGNNDGGGGVNIYQGVTGTLFTNCIIRANTHTGKGGGGVYTYAGGSVTTFANCEITDNTVTSNGRGGGGTFNNEASEFTFYNCLIARNRATGDDSKGGGCYTHGGEGQLRFNSCTIASNSVKTAGLGGGIARNYNTMSLANTIVYFNMAGSDQNNISLFNGATVSASYSCVTAPDLGGTGMTNANPQFVDLAGGDYGLGAGSPCINRGTVDPSWMAGATDLDGSPRIYQDVVDMGAFESWPRVPMIRNGGIAKVTDTTAIALGSITWLGHAEVAMFVCHGPSDGGTNRQAWAYEVRFPGAMNVGNHEVGISHKASTSTWCYRCFTTNRHGVAWADFTGGLMLGAVEVKVTKRESTEEKPGAFVISRPATATNGPLDVYFTLGGTGVNGVDYDKLDIPAIIPAGATEIRLPVVPNFNMGEERPKGVELTIVPGGYLIGVNSKASMSTRPPREGP